MTAVRRVVRPDGYFWLNHYEWCVGRPAGWLQFQPMPIWVVVDRDVPMAATVYRDRACTERLGSASRGEYTPLVRG